MKNNNVKRKMGVYAWKKEIRQQVLDKYHCRCAYCGVEIDMKTMQVDHIRSKSSFVYGWQSEIPAYCIDDICNLNPSCRRCNNFKAGMRVERFRSELQAQVERARERSVNFRMAEKFGQIKITESPIMFYFERRNNNEI